MVEKTEDTLRKWKQQKDISQSWVKKYVDTLLELAKSFGPETPMGQVAIQKAEHAMDMVEAFREEVK